MIAGTELSAEGQGTRTFIYTPQIQQEDLRGGRHSPLGLDGKRGAFQPYQDNILEMPVKVISQHD
jgi:hypothetical protein